MSSATFDPTWTDPFGQPALTAAQTPADEAARAEALAGTTASSLEPGELGIALGSIMIGSRTRAATINGEACHEGDVVAVTDKHDKAVIHHLRVMRIVREGVELDLGGRKIMVELAQPKLAQGDDFERGKPKERN